MAAAARAGGHGGGRDGRRDRRAAATDTVSCDVSHEPGHARPGAYDRPTLVIVPSGNGRGQRREAPVRRSSIVLILPLLLLALTTGCGAVSAASIAVALAPAHTLALPPGGMQTFTATVTGTPNAAVAWTATCGSLSGSGNVVTYTAPSEASTCTITAASVADPSASDAVVVTVVGASTGDIVWLRQYATAGGAVVPADVAVDAMGRVLVTGYASGGLQGGDGRPDAFVFQLDPAGEVRWWWPSETADTDWGSAVAAGPAGQAFVTGYVAGDFGAPEEGRVFLVQIDADGEELWRRQFGAAQDEYGLGVVADADGNAFVAWTTTGELGEPTERAFVSAFDPAGDEFWRSQFDERYPLGAIALSADGDVMVTGETDRGIVVVTLTRDLGIETGRRYFDLDDVVTGAHLLPDGGLYLTGTTTLGNPGGEFDAHVTAFDADGAVAWRRQLGTAGNDHGRAVAVDAAGRVLMAGATESPDAADGEWMDAFVVALGPDGAELWRRHFGTTLGGRDWASAAAFGPDGAPVVIGGTHGNLVRVAFDTARVPAPFSEEPFDEEPGTQTFVMKLSL
jgi:hypothetical protein